MYFVTKIEIITNVATKIQQILEANPNMTVSFGSWLSKQ